MGTVTHLGSSTSEDDIPQPPSIIMGNNLTAQATAEDAVVALMRRCNIPLTRQNYVDLAYCGDPPKPWGAELEANLPVELQDWSQFGRRPPPLTPEHRDDRVARAAFRASCVNPCRPALDRATLSCTSDLSIEPVSVHTY